MYPAIDSSNPEALKAGLCADGEKAFVNPMTVGKKRLEEVISGVKNYNCKIVALTVDEEGIPEDVDKRYKIAGILA